MSPIQEVMSPPGGAGIGESLGVPSSMGTEDTTNVRKDRHSTEELGDSEESYAWHASWDDFNDGLASETDSDNDPSSSGSDDGESLDGPRGGSATSTVSEKRANLCSIRSIVNGVLGADCGCTKDCTSRMCRGDVMEAREATSKATEERKLQQHTREKLLNVMHTSSINETKTFRFMFNGITICNESFRLVHGFSVAGMRNAMTWCKADANRRAQLDTSRASSSSSKLPSFGVGGFAGLGGTERNLAAQVWIDGYVSTHGCQMPDSGHVHIDNVPWGEIHEEYSLDTKEECRPLQFSAFRKVWKKEFAHVKKRRRKPFGECAVCAGYKSQLKDERKDPNQRARTMALYVAHLQHQQLERKRYYARRAKGKRGRCISIIMDGMDQSKTDLPHTEVALKSDSNMVETKITGVMVHGRSFNCYVSEPQVRHDTNLSLTCLHHTLMEELKEGPPVDTLYVQVDGGSENKNQWVLAYFVLLISLGLFTKIKMCFLPVGHTHEDIDQGFSCIARKLRRCNAYTFGQLVEVVKASFQKENKPPNVFQIGESFDWKTFVASEVVEGISSWTDNHIYRFSWNPYHKQVQMHYKKFDQSEGYFGLHESTFVTSFKAVEREVAKDPEAWDAHAGVLLGTKDKPPGQPTKAANIDFTAPKITQSGKEG